MNGSKKRTTAGVEDSGDPKGDLLGGRRRDLHRDLTNLASQVQMMSDSLAACKQMSKARPLRKMYCMKANARRNVTAAETSVQALLSPGEGVPENRDEEDEQVIVSYMVGESYKLRKSESDGAEGWLQQSWGRRRGSVTSATEECPEMEEGSSKIEMYEHGEVDASRMIDVIRRELKALGEMAPSVASLATALSDTICHYKECDRCSEKISPSLPWILNRIQKLIKYVTTQRLGSYRWPDDRHYLRLRPPDPAAPPLPPPTGPERLLANAGQLDPASAAEDIPGLQLLLEVSPDHTTRKKLFQKADNRPVAPADSFLNFSVVHLRQPQSQPLVQVLLPGHDPPILLQEKRQAVVLKEFAHAPRLVFAFRLSPSASFLLASPAGSLTRTRRTSLPLPASAPGLERSLRPRKKNSEGPPQGPRQGKEKAVRHTETLPKRSNDNLSSSPRDLLARVPEIVKDFLLEAEEEKMHDQNMRNLEAGAKGLRDLMTEVHRNQLELSKVLLEKGVYPQPIIKLTDPEMLEKETEVMRKVAEFQGPGPNRASVEALQTALDELRHKCALKNRVILIILKGLRSNIPKEWWEDMVEYVFEERKPIEDFGPEKARAPMGRTPGLPRNAEQAPKLQGRPLRAEEQPSEEEASVRGNVGADVEECLEKLWKCDGVVAKRKAVTSEGLSEGESPSGIGTSIRKLEKQVSLLNSENERLKHEVQDLKNLLRSSVDQLRDRRVSRVEWDHRPSSRSPGKTINLTIEIVDKEHRPTRDATRPRNFPVEGAAGRARSLALKYRDADSSSGPADSDTDEGEPEQELGRVSPIRAEAESPRNSVEEPGAGPRERTPGAAAHGQPSGQETLRKSKPAGRVASEASDGCVAGPSRRSPDVGRLLQKPSVMELAESECPGTMAAMANERELQTIPENECGPSASSKGLSQAIQRLRSRVRSIHKDVTVLKSKNDRIDKLLDRLMEDALENGEGFEEMESKLNRLKEQLG